MKLTFTVSGIVNKPISKVFESIVDPQQLSKYFTTGGAKGRLESGKTVTWEFHDFPGAFPVDAVKIVDDEKIVLRWPMPSDLDEGQTTVTMHFSSIDKERTQVQISEEGWPDTKAGLEASYGNCAGWMQFICALKGYLEHGINLREGMYK